MPKASDINPVKKISILLKSPYGFGKTIAACSMAVDGPVWLAYWDKQEPVELLTFFRKHRPELLNNIDYDVYSAKNANEYMNKLIAQNKKCDYIGHINDSVTNMTSAAVNWSLGFRNPKGPKTDKTMGTNNLLFVPDFDEYKVETSMVTQSLDLCRTLPCHVIWTCHPLPSLKIEGSGSSVKVSKVNNIVTYGSKVGAIVPGQFTEIYHLSFDNSWDTATGTSRTRRIVNTVGNGDDFAKTALDLPAEIDITDKLFWEEWKNALS
jgi:hypothetical protein